MRISERQRYNITNARIENTKYQHAQKLENLSTLKRINKVSDDPLGLTKVISLKDKIKNIDQIKKNLDFAKGFLERSESAIANIEENLIRAKELAINLSNATQDQNSRSAAALEIKKILKEIVHFANTSYGNKFIFSGFRTNIPPLSEDGEYIGDDGVIFLHVDENDMRQINIQARYLFETSDDERKAGHLNMIDCIKTLHTGLNENDMNMIHKALDDLDFQIEKAVSYRAKCGAYQNALYNIQKKLEMVLEQDRQLKSNIEEVDIFEVASDFKRSEAILQSTLLASNKMLQPSLLNFMQ